MSERSIYLRDQARKCEFHASQMTAPDVIAQLRKLASDYLIEAAEVEPNEISKAAI